MKYNEYLKILKVFNNTLPDNLQLTFKGLVVISVEQHLHQKDTFIVSCYNKNFTILSTSNDFDIIEKTPKQYLYVYCKYNQEIDNLERPIVLINLPEEFDSDRDVLDQYVWKHGHWQINKYFQNEASENISLDDDNENAIDISGDKHKSKLTKKRKK